MNSKNYDELLEEVKCLRAEKERLTKENMEYKHRYDIGITAEELEEQYKAYYSN